MSAENIYQNRLMRRFSCTAEKVQSDDNGTPIPVSVVLNSPSGRNIELENLLRTISNTEGGASWKE